MATIDFLPVCSHCHQVLWGETIDVIREKELINQSNIMAMLNTNIYPARCPYCKEPFTSVTIPTKLPYCCEPLWPIKIEED